MIRCFIQKNRLKMLLPGIVALVILGTIEFSPLAIANAQGLFGLPFWNSYLALAPRYPYDFLSPFLGRWTAGSGLLPSTLLAGNPSPTSPLRFAHASIQGVTTIFIPPSATNFKLVVKPSTGDAIKLTALVPPLTAYIYPTGYIPPTLVTTPTVVTPVTTPAVVTPVTTPAVVTPVTTPVTTPLTTPTTTLPTSTTSAPAVISGLGGLQQVFPSPLRPTFSPYGSVFQPLWPAASLYPIL